MECPISNIATISSVESAQRNALSRTRHLQRFHEGFFAEYLDFIAEMNCFAVL